MNYASKLREIRESFGLSTYQLGKLIGASQSTISKLENGQRRIDVEIVEKICDSLGLSLLDFFDSEKPSLPSDLIQLVETAKKLSPEERKKFHEFMKIFLAKSQLTTGNYLEADK
jgi:HTH-type transcriptional regulator, repressor for puuD